MWPSAELMTGQDCPEPRNEEEWKLQQKEDKSYVRGRVS